MSIDSPLSEDQEKSMEKKITWILGMIRSGTTWFATQLLRHEKNLVWNEPMIGHHLYSGGIFNDNSIHRNRDEYFFSNKYEDDWLPLFKKFVLGRLHLGWKDFTKNLIIKEPTASGVSPTLMKCFQNSKLIFLIRDGRDIIDSIVDSHREGSWSRAQPFQNKNQRLNEIKNQSMNWNFFIEQNWLSYTKHSPNLRLFLKYEDLLDNTFEELKKVYHFLDLDVTDDFLNTQIQKYDFKKIPDSQKGTGKFNRAASPGLWKVNFDEEEQNLMTDLLKNNLKKFNYT